MSDAVWPDRPPPSKARLVVHPDAIAGRTSADKRTAMAEEIKGRNADAAILTALDSIAWTFNIRGVDVDRTPVALAFAVVGTDGTADLFTEIEKVDEAVIHHLGNAVRIHPRGAFAGWLAGQGGRSLIVDPERSVVAIFEALADAGATVIEARDPAVLPKAIKNPIEIAGHKAAQLRDGAALTRFLHWLSVEAQDGRIDELTASDRLHDFRRATGQLRDLSFDTISGAGPNGAVVHYRASPETNRLLLPGLVDLHNDGLEGEINPRPGVNLPLRDDDPDYPALVLANYMLGGGFLNSRLATRIRQKEGISYGVSSGLRADPLDKVGSFLTFAIYNPQNSARLLAAWREEIDRMLQQGFTEAELKDARAGWLQGRGVSRSQDRELVGKLASYLYLGRTLAWDAQLEQRVAALTVADVNAAVKRWIKPSQITVVEAGDFGAGAAPVK